jgi:dynein light intermediate chain 1
VLTRLGIYTLDNSSDYKSLLPFVINKENLESFLVVIVLDMSRPWTVLQSLDHWLKVIDTHIKSLDAPNVDELRGKGVCARACVCACSACITSV